MLDDRLYTIETPEQIDVAYDVAGIGSRFLAALIDHALLAIMLGLACTGVSLFADQLDLGADESLLAGLFGLGVYLSLCAYYIFWETVWNGQTPGKRMIGLRMVRTGGRPLGFIGSAIRNFIRLADFLPVLYGLGVLVMFFDKHGRRLGDLAAGCMAVRERKAVTLDSLSAPTIIPPIVPAAQQITIPNLQRVQREDYEIVQEYLRQRAGLSIETRQRLSRQIVEGLTLRLGFPVQGNPETFLYIVAAEYQALQQKQTASPRED